MDVDQIIRELTEERKRLGKIIEALEKRAVDVKARPRSTRGRKSMDADARREVSERMKRYWAARREGSGQAPPPAEERTLTAGAGGFIV